MKHTLAGTYAALLSGFADDGDFSPDRQHSILAHVAGHDLTGFYVGGSSGEDGLMSTDELLEQQAVVAEAPGAANRTLIAHVGRPALGAAIRLARSAEALGYHAVSALPPYAYGYSDAEILAYYRALTAATGLPMIAYEIPVRTGRAMPLELLSEILTLPGIVGLKYTSTDLFKMSRLRAAHPDKLIFFGFDEIAGAAAFLGTSGGIGTTYNNLGSLYTALFAAVDAGDVAKARALQQISQEFVTIVLDCGVFPGCKIAMQVLGVDSGPCRAPLSIKDTSTVDRIRAFLARPDVACWLSAAHT